MSFSNILGQEFAVSLFQRALKEGKLAHAYLLTGPDGVGKRSLAKEVAKALNCKQNEIQNACDLCRECRLIDSGRYADLTLLNPENQVLKIETVRRLQQEVALKPYESRFRIAIIEEVDQMTPDAAHAFLKTLEEPSGGVFFFLTTRCRERVFATILSRCQVVPMKPISKEIFERQKVPAALIHLAQGSFSRLSHWMSPEAGKRRTEILDAFLNGKFEQPPESKGANREEEKAFIEERLLLLQSVVRDLLVWRKTGNESLLIHWDYRERIKEESARFSIVHLRESAIKMDRLARGLEQNANLKLLQGVIELNLQDLILDTDFR